jgi:hypothetical protein
VIAPVRNDMLGVHACMERARGKLGSGAARELAVFKVDEGEL